MGVCDQMMGGFLMSVGSFPCLRQSVQIAPILSPNFILVMMQLIAVCYLRSLVSTASQASSRKAEVFMQPLTARRYCWYFSQSFTGLQRSVVAQCTNSPFQIVQYIMVYSMPALYKASLNSFPSLSSLASAKSRPFWPSLQKGLSGTEQVKLLRLDGLGKAKFLGAFKSLKVVQVGQISQQLLSQSQLALFSLLNFKQTCSIVQEQSSILKQSLTWLKSY